ncbi:hypothetical protein SLNSH_04255 [Alsobacter soli]|uniref:Cytochrome P450 n=1 Tax=Alsobacter soli TaxID=2109933 RepID=A0A2T1HXT1_9HYPH|nr:hypothetical protein SLNSH_04255 [Alsobacter soli]
MVLRRLLSTLRGDAPSPTQAAVGSPLDLLDPVFLENPYPTYAALRVHDPVHRTRSGAWFLTRHADVAAAFGDRRLGNAPAPTAVIARRNRDRFVCADVAANILPFLDKPEHGAVRRIVAGALRARLGRLDLELPQLAGSLLEPCLERRSMEVMSEFGRPLSVAVISLIMGLPIEDAARLDAWSDAFFHLFAPMPSEAARVRVDQDLAEFRDYLRQHAAARRRAGGDDLISELMQTEAEGRILSEPELLDACMLIYADGIENIDAAIANTLLALGGHPEEQRRLEREPERARAVAQEGIRFDTPGQFIARIAREDLVIAGRSIPQGGVVLLALAAANRDPVAFEKPDRFAPDRSEGGALTFGQGRHGCLGANLVRLQVAAALQALFTRTRRLAIDDGPVRYKARVGHRWPERLHIRFEPT